MFRACRALALVLSVTAFACSARAPQAQPPSAPPWRPLPVTTAASTSTAPSRAPQRLAAAEMPKPIALPTAALAFDGPLSVERAAPDGRWLVSCQAQRDTDGDGRLFVGVAPNGQLSGDALHRYLTLSTGEEEPIDALLASSPDGRWLVLERDGKAELYDAETRARLDLTALGADTRREASARLPHRTLLFDGDSLIYSRKTASGFELVERALASGSERTLYSSQETLVRVELEPSSRAFVLSVAGADENGNGRFDWPYALEHGPMRCRAPVTRFLTPRLGADPLGTILVPREGGRAVRADDLAGVLGDVLLRRDGEGAIIAEQRGHRFLVGDRNCAGRLVWMDALRDNVLLGCAMPKKPGRLAVELVRGGQHTPLDIDVAALPFDAGASTERLAPLYPGADVVLFDGERRQLHRLQSGDLVLATLDAHALVRRGRTLLLFDAETASTAPIAGALDPFGALLRQGSVVFAAPLVVDLASGHALGTIAGEALALTTSGAALVPRVSATATSLAEGPLTWQSPIVATAPSQLVAGSRASRKPML